MPDGDLSKDQTLDLESDSEKASLADVDLPSTLRATDAFNLEPYNKEKATDKARQMIGLTLLCLLIVIVIIAFIILAIIQVHSADLGKIVFATLQSKLPTEQESILIKAAAETSKADWDRLSALMNIVFGPVVTLLGSVTGFYFGTQSAKAGPAP